jgi:predicted kinase
VLIDATFRHLEDRQVFAAQFGAGCYMVECWAPPEVLLARSERRGRDADRVSDADRGVVERLLHDWDPLTEVAGDRHIVLRSDRPPERIVADLLNQLDLRLSQRPGR